LWGFSLCNNSKLPLALLDMRIVNMDRHSGNLLLLHREKPHKLGPIDHGCCLPPWWLLGEAIFDAWIDFVQLKQAPSAASRSTIRLAYESLPHTCNMVREQVGLPEPAIVTLQLSTLLLYIGVGVYGIPCASMAKLILRDEDTGFAELSWLEAKVEAAANTVGCPCRKEENRRGDQVLAVDDEDGRKLDVDRFLRELERLFRLEVCTATGCEHLQAAPILEPSTSLESDASGPNVPASRW